MLTVIGRFNAICARQPEALALISDNASLTYGQLSARVTGMATLIERNFIKAIGRSPGSGDVIAVSLDKGVDLYAAILAILSVGASYVPVDPTLPTDLQAHMLDACRCEFVVAPQALQVAATCKRMDPHEAEAESHASSGGDPDPSRRTMVHRCYTIFTSGSTGRPKGVQITDCNLLNLVDWMQSEFALGADHRVLQYSTINFDASILDIFPPLLSGATLCIPSHDQRMSAALLRDFCAYHQVNHAFLPPALLSVLDAAQFPTLRNVLTGGEACSPSTLRSWVPGRRFYNLYGPTECTVLVSFKPMEITTSRTNIGQAIPGARLHVLNDELSPVKRGELHVAGLAVSPGYMSDEATTNRKFVACPAVDEGMLYKTGDIVERDAVGDLHFVGRVDRQVKVRGYRIELEEIEGALARLGCLQAAVKSTTQGELAAYVVLPPALSMADVRRRLSEELSDFKVPSFFHELGHFPLKASGKVDYDALPGIGPGSPEMPSPFPADPALKALTTLTALWSEVLGVPAQMLDADSNFRHLGGTSIKIVRLLSAMERRFDVRVPFAEFLRNPTLGYLFTTLQKT